MSNPKKRPMPRKPTEEPDDRAARLSEMLAGMEEARGFDQTRVRWMGTTDYFELGFGMRDDMGRSRWPVVAMEIPDDPEAERAAIEWAARRTEARRRTMLERGPLAAVCHPDGSIGLRDPAAARAALVAKFGEPEPPQPTHAECFAWLNGQKHYTITAEGGAMGVTISLEGWGGAPRRYIGNTLWQAVIAGIEDDGRWRKAGERPGSGG